MTATPQPDQHVPAPLSREILASGTRWMVIGRLVTQVTRFGVSLLLARLLTPEAFGLVAIAMTTILALEVLRDLGTGAAMIQRPAVDQTLLSSVFALNVLIGVLLTAAMAGGAGLLATLFAAPEAEPVVRALSVVVLLQALAQTHHAVLRRRMLFRGVAAVEMTGALVNAAVSIALALLGWGVWAMVWGNIAGVTAGTVIAWLRSGWRPSATVSWRSLRSIARFSLNTAGYNAAALVLREADKVLVSRVLGPAPLGVYTLGQRTINYPVESIAQVLMTVLFPAFSRVQDDNAALRKGYARASGAIAFVVLPLMIGTAVVAEPIVLTVLGAQWAGLVPLLQFMAPAGAMAALLSAVNTIYSAKGRADYMFRFGVASGALTLTAIAVGLQWGLPGLAVAYLAALTIQTPVGLRLALGLIDMPLSQFLRGLMPYAAMSGLMAVAAGGAVLGTAPLGSTVQLASGVTAGVVVYSALAAWWRPQAVRDVWTLIRHR